MKKIKIALALAAFTLSSASFAQHYSSEPPKVSPMPMKPEMTEIWEPEVAVVTPGKNLGDAPSDAIVLFDGSNFNQWESAKDPSIAVPWDIIDGDYMQVKPNSGNIQTKMKFGDCQLHIEFSAPDDAKGVSQGRGNSGIFFQNRYELQVLDSYHNRTYRNGQAGAIYKDHAPLVNPIKGPLEWNKYDIVYTAPRFKENGQIDYPARITVFMNGVLVQNNATINGLTLYIGLHNYPEAHGEDVISLQDHGNTTQFRNIWIRPL
ncbi:DUF1080 domain-containing protein [Marinilongibacter aquaticus]|uniref:3-keto-disaccharide hydrolase n=1 Tax=Marinilongibacter aquaticus TaxID=2975157 RepID=UPI0021BDAE00|nr:DUF1080 domain-containing protein [Marinilongibacter aquaticus]UBM60870.1 DUF1080 domain-containing protein [Marinilongibacter aquaticus]